MSFVTDSLCSAQLVSYFSSSLENSSLSHPVFQVELYLIAGVFAYILFAVYGNISNSRRANKWFLIYFCRIISDLHPYRFKEHLPLLQQQFSRPSLGALTQDGYSDYFNFSTGRRAIASLHTIFTLQPRHDFFQWAFHTLRTFVDLQYRPVDDLQLDFKLHPGHLPYDFVWGLVAKTDLLYVKDYRWDLVSRLLPLLYVIRLSSFRVSQRRPKTPSFPLACLSCLVGYVSRIFYRHTNLSY